MYQIEYLLSTTSTQDEVKRRLDSFDPKIISAIVAKEQSAGRGREGRVFRSPEGGLYMTAAIHIEGPLQKHIALSLLVGLAISRLSEKIRLKWPNDLLIEGKKVGGILIETSAPWWLVGIGINISTPMEALADLDVPVTTLVHEGVDLPDLDQLILDGLEEVLPEFLAKGFAPFQEEYLEKSAFRRGQAIVVQGRGKVVFEGVSPLGELEIKAQGKKERLNFAEINFGKMP